MSEMIEHLLRRDRQIVAAGLVAVSIACWAWLLTGAGMDMSAVEMTRHTLMRMDMMRAGPWSPDYVAMMFFMWWIMMIAMMLPSASPVVLLAASLNRRADRAVYGSTLAFTSGYLLAWGLFSGAAVALQWWLTSLDLVGGMLFSTSNAFNGGLLMLAGAWQFTPWKQACLKHCRGPVEFLTAHRRPGHGGALVMGLHHGVYCLGCCWFLMVLLFVGGVMNLLWIAGLAIYVWIEKLGPAGHLASRIAGVLLITWGAAILWGA